VGLIVDKKTNLVNNMIGIDRINRIPCPNCGEGFVDKETTRDIDIILEKRFDLFVEVRCVETNNRSNRVFEQILSLFGNHVTGFGKFPTTLGVTNNTVTYQLGQHVGRDLPSVLAGWQMRNVLGSGDNGDFHISEFVIESGNVGEGKTENSDHVRRKTRVDGLDAINPDKGLGEILVTFPITDYVFHNLNQLYARLSYNILVMDDFFKGLNKEQKEAVVFGKGPLLILAGAGSGKTRVLTYRTAYLIREKKVKPEQVALLTFTNKAAEEMKERVKKLQGKSVSLGFAGTFHTFCAKLLREYGTNADINPNYVIFDSDDSEAAMKKVLKEMDIDPKESKPSMFLAVIGKMKNDLVSLSEAETSANDYFRRMVVKVWKAYQDKLKNNNAVDFDDLLVKAVALLRIERIRKEINERLQWILVDEYQDTNKAQFELTKLLAGERQNITAVGDAAQAIYSFRGADYRNLVLFKNEYPKASMVSLPMNYRSTQNILDTAYGVISHNTSHPTLHLETTAGVGEMVDFFEASDERDEAKYVIEQARKSSAEDGQSAILYRTNAQSRAFEDELMRRDIPYKLVGGLRFYNRAEIKDLIAYLRVVNNPKEEISRARIEKLGKRRAAIFDKWLETQSTKKRSGNPGKLLEEIINVVGFLERFDERDEDDVARIENINELLAVASDYENVEKFLESAALSESDIKQHRSNAKITLMTIHAAKGLEFETVFVVGLEEGLFPHSRSMLSGEKEEIEEERRLMYVAMTRAKIKLTLSWARSRLVFGGRHSSIPSRFLSEIPEKHLKKIGEVRDVERKMSPKTSDLDEFGEKKRIIVQDWEIAEATKDDFAEIDNW